MMRNGVIETLLIVLTSNLLVAGSSPAGGAEKCKLRAPIQGPRRSTGKDPVAGASSAERAVDDDLPQSVLQNLEFPIVEPLDE